MREKEFKAIFDGEKYVMPQEMKYRVKNRITEKATAGKPFFKRSVSAMVSVVLASILVITAAAVGGVALFQSIYGENMEPIMPYSEIINTTASDENYELTLHEAVADEYTTAYIFSVKRLTVGASKAPEKNNAMIFGGFGQSNYWMDHYLEYYNPQEKPEIFIGFNGYDNLQTQIFRASKDDRVVLIRTGAAYNAENGARYLMRAIDNLKTEDTDYYALYIITGDDQTLSVGVGSNSGPEIALPKVTQKAPSVTRSVQDYYRQYLKQTEPGVVFGSTRLADTVTITPLAVYVKNTEGAQSSHYYSYFGTNYTVDYIDSAFYRTAKLAFSDGTEKLLSEMSQDEQGIKLSDTAGVYLFNEVLDTSLVKSFLVYDTVEFPMDMNLPVIDRETGAEIVPKYETVDLLYDVGTDLSKYLDSMYPGERKQNATYCGEPHYQAEDSCRIQGSDCIILLTGYDVIEGETLTDAARRMLEEYRIKYGWNISEMTVKGGTSSLGDVKYAKVNFTILDGEASEINIFFFEKDGKLITLQLTQGNYGQPYYSLDALLKLITFN